MFRILYKINFSDNLNSQLHIGSCQSYVCELPINEGASIFRNYRRHPAPISGIFTGSIVDYTSARLQLRKWCITGGKVVFQLVVVACRHFVSTSHIPDVDKWPSGGFVESLPRIKFTLKYC